MNRLPRKLSLFLGTLLFLRAPRLLAEPSAAAVAAFNSYTHAVETRLARQHRSGDAFLALPDADSRARLRSGELLIEQLTPGSGAEVPGALLHHWRGTAFVPNATAADFEQLLRNFNAYPQEFAPQILRANILSRSGGHMLVRLRIRQHHVITVVMDATYDVTFGARNVQHGYSISRSTRIDEIESAGAPGERALTPAEEHGFLYRLNTYWSYEQRDGGLYLQIEAVSLTRSIPQGLGWALRPYIESIPRDSLVFTLTSARNALCQQSRLNH